MRRKIFYAVREGRQQTTTSSLVLIGNKRQVVEPNMPKLAHSGTRISLQLKARLIRENFIANETRQLFKTTNFHNISQPDDNMACLGNLKIEACVNRYDP